MLAGLVRPHVPALALALLLLSAQSVATLLQPWLAGELSTRLLQGREAFASLLWVLFALVVAQAALGYVQSILLQRVSGELVADAGTRLYAHLQSLPLAWHNERRRGDVLALLLGDIRRLASYLTGIVLPLLPLLLTFFGALVVMLRMAPVIGLAVAVLLPAVFVLLRLAGRKLRPLGLQAAQAWADQAAQADRNLSMLPVIKAFAADRTEAENYRGRVVAVRDIELRQRRLEGAIMPVVQVLGAGIVLLLLGLAGDRIARGELTTSQLVTLFLYGLVLIQPVGQLAQVYGGTMSARGALQRLEDAFAALPEPDTGTRTLDGARGELGFEGISFAYPGRPPLFEGFDLHVRAGETVALTGVNGAGKSTLVHLLLRFMAPDRGRITVDGADVSDISLVSLRSRIGLVAQQVQLFNATVAENIAYGSAGAGREEIERAAVAARAHDFVMRLPDGYDTVIGDQGVKLSGGQKQRIALARALLKDPVILILDEATAMFDPEGEREFIEACHDVLGLRTVLLITHRPASLALADRIVRIEDGRPVDPDGAARVS
ncbi:MAG: ABC transporter ATP-binding protein [Burkholderiaceae bacterium]|nr:ABC transporter ATP-binding protein [Burkholderiaceae bacterium]